MVYGQLVNSNYLSSLALRSYKDWNSTIISEEQVEKLAYIADSLDKGTSNVIDLQNLLIEDYQSMNFI